MNINYSMPAKDFFKEIGKRQLTNNIGIARILLGIITLFGIVFSFIELEITDRTVLQLFFYFLLLLDVVLFILNALLKNAVYKELNLGSVIEITIAFGKIFVKSEGCRISVKTSIITNVEENKEWIYLSCTGNGFGVFGNCICVPKSLFENEKSIENFKEKFLQQKQKQSG